jgi:hypothetical protein
MRQPSNPTPAQLVVPETNAKQPLAESQYLDNLPKPLKEIYIDNLENEVSSLQRENEALKKALHILGWNIR